MVPARARLASHATSPSVTSGGGCNRRIHARNSAYATCSPPAARNALGVVRRCRRTAFRNAVGDANASSSAIASTGRVQVRSAWATASSRHHVISACALPTPCRRQRLQSVFRCRPIASAIPCTESGSAARASAIRTSGRNPSGTSASSSPQTAQTNSARRSRVESARTTHPRSNSSTIRTWSGWDSSNAIVAAHQGADRRTNASTGIASAPRTSGRRATAAWSLGARTLPEHRTSRTRAAVAAPIESRGSRIAPATRPSPIERRACATVAHLARANSAPSARLIRSTASKAVETTTTIGGSLGCSSSAYSGRETRQSLGPSSPARHRRAAGMLGISRAPPTGIAPANGVAHRDRLHPFRPVRRTGKRPQPLRARLARTEQFVEVRPRVHAAV